MTSNSNQQPESTKAQTSESQLQYKSIARMLTYEEIESAFERTYKRASEQIKHLEDSTYSPLPSTTTAGPLPFAGPTVITREQELEAQLQAALAEIERMKAPQKWVKCSERMPTEKDADCDDYVWWKWPDRMNPLRRRWDSKFSCAVYWQPTGLKRPEPPKDEA